MKKNKLSFVTS